MIDIHTHILFGVDDGAVDLEMSLRLLRDGVEEGITTFILTPHLKYYDLEYQKIIQNNFQLLKSELDREFSCVKLYLAGEIHFTYDLFKYVESGWGLSGGDNKCLLLEFPFEQFPFTAYSVIEKLNQAGVQTVIAHPERIPSLVQNKSALAKLKELQCLFQITAGSLNGSFGRSVENVAWRLLGDDYADFIASDVHHPEWRPFGMKTAYSAVKNKYGNSMAEKLFYKNQLNLILGEERV